MKPFVLTIAGSDPSGGAGLQQDLSVFAALGVAGRTAVTALTVQDGRGVYGVYPVEPRVLREQLEVTLPGVSAVKIGMLGGAAQVETVAEALERYRPRNVVLDPVLTATSGDMLTDDGGRDAIVERLLPLCDLVTPNAPEAAALAGIEVTSPAELREAARRIMALGARAVLAKGGHLEGEPTDIFVAHGFETEFGGERVDTPHTHGTGCFLSSSIASVLALGHSLPDAIAWSKRFLTVALRHPIVPEEGRGSPDAHAAAALPTPPTARPPAEPARVRPDPRIAGIYVITDATLRPDRSHEEIVLAAVEGGARLVQIRDKRLSPKEVAAVARRVVPITRRAGALLIINDLVGIVEEAGADGVHLGPDDLHPREAREVLGKGKIIGASVGSVEEAARVAPYVSYLAVGAIFGSGTKRDAGPPVGHQRISEIKRAFPEHPIVAVGGIGPPNIAEVAAAGADAAAVISAVVTADDMRAAVRELVASFSGGR